MKMEHILDWLVNQVIRQSELLSVDFADVQKKSAIPPVQPMTQRTRLQVKKVKTFKMTSQKLLRKRKRRAVYALEGSQARTLVTRTGICDI